MGGNSAADIDGIGYLTIQRALDIARNSEGDVDATVANYLEKAIRELWSRLNAQPSSYVFTKEEFSLFNYFRQRFAGYELAQRAIQRFWNHYEGDPSRMDLD